VPIVERGTPLSIRWLWAAARVVAARPALWVTAVRQASVLAVDGWWRRPPFLPLPDPAYLRFRLQTAYGDAAHAPSPADLVTYLHWCRAWPHVAAPAPKGRGR
jgi:hypothetical protein